MGVWGAKMDTPIIYRFGLKIILTAFCGVPSSEKRLEIDIVVESLRILQNNPKHDIASRQWWREA